MAEASSKAGQAVALIDAAKTVLHHAAQHLHADPQVQAALLDLFSDARVRAVFDAAQNRTQLRLQALKRKEGKGGLSKAECNEFVALAEALSGRTQFDPWQEDAMSVIERAAALLPPTPSTATEQAG